MVCLYPAVLLSLLCDPLFKNQRAFSVSSYLEGFVFADGVPPFAPINSIYFKRKKIKIFCELYLYSLVITYVFIACEQRQGKGEQARMSDQNTDLILVEQVLSGNKQAFNRLVLKYQNKVCNLVSRYVADKDVQDVAQETFIKAYRSLASFRQESAFYTWLYRIAVNTAKNYLTAQSRRPPGSDIDAQEAEFYDLGGAMRDIETPENQMQTEELKHVIFDAIDNLPDDLKTVITLREIEGLSYEEIAEVIDSPIGTVRSRIFRARDAIEKKMRSLISND